MTEQEESKNVNSSHEASCVLWKTLKSPAGDEISFTVRADTPELCFDTFVRGLKYGKETYDITAQRTPPTKNQVPPTENQAPPVEQAPAPQEEPHYENVSGEDPSSAKRTAVEFIERSQTLSGSKPSLKVYGGWVTKWGLTIYPENVPGGEKYIESLEFGKKLIPPDGMKFFLLGSTVNEKTKKPAPVFGGFCE